jgi:hypothetical protein
VGGCGTGARSRSGMTRCPTIKSQAGPESSWSGSLINPSSLAWAS